MTAEFFRTCCSGHAAGPSLVIESPKGRPLCIAALLLLLFSGAVNRATAQSAYPQQPTTTDSQGAPDTGMQMGDYTVRQSIEFGGRITSRTGSEAMYDTLVNQQSGPRLFQQSLSVQPMHTQGMPFDNLYVDSFGWGGDPNNAARLRINKKGLYNFNGSFRRDQNYFDYDLFANPLNPTSTNPAFPTITVNRSPHAYDTRRRMYDFNLVLLPQRVLSFVVGYNRNRSEGPSLYSYHQGTEALLDQKWNTTADTLRFGVNLRITPKTTLSYTQLLKWLKNDTSYTLAPFTRFLLPDGSTPVDLGLSWLNSGSPCAAPLIGSFANPACNGYLSYNRGQRYRNYIPTEQVSLSSRSIKNLDFTARFAYSNADANTPQIESFNGLETRTTLRQFNTTGTTAKANWVSNEGNAGFTYYLGQHVRLVDSFRYFAFRIPGSLNLIQSNFFNAAAPASMLSPTATFPPSVLHNASSPADLLNDLFSQFVQQTVKANNFQVQIDFSRRIGVRAGYDYRNIFDRRTLTTSAISELYNPLVPNRGNCVGLPLNPDGSCTFTGIFDSADEPVEINQHTAIGGLWVRPTDALHFDAEVRLMTGDNFLTRIDPRRQNQYRANASYTPRPWLNLAANLNMIEQRNNTQDFHYSAHFRNYGFSAMVAPSGRFTLDLAYNFSDAQQNDNICYIGGVVIPGSTTCLNSPALRETLGFYNNQTHYGSANVMFRPVKRVSASVGYSVVNVDGNVLLTDLLQPVGTSSYWYHQPSAQLGISITKQLEWRAGWNYYQYNENSAVGPTAPRYFHANLTNLSLRYSF